ncbi:hypothetical protein [Arsenicicoccus piscis]|uniref:Uncharacterized protein n=1 Tax=Arsenicicoccus piscis TaxID=673954 RepID=A0ABQ6HMB7_9MICO|nr:hypothetical protein [Arsenicicoccus piscis]GMA19467.1 hypothetical protein GCM10025862_14880 [Arsenicicoccus piscis]
MPRRQSGAVDGRLGRRFERLLGRRLDDADPTPSATTEKIPVEVTDVFLYAPVDGQCVGVGVKGMGGMGGGKGMSGMKGMRGGGSSSTPGTTTPTPGSTTPGTTGTAGAASYSA